MKLKTRITRTLAQFQEHLKNRTVSLLVVNLSIVTLEFVYLALRMKYLNAQIPFWYTKMWGDWQLAPRNYLYLIPLVSLVILLMGTIILTVNRYYIQYLVSVIWIGVTFTNLLLAYSIYKIVQLSSIPFDPLINPLYLGLVPPFLVSFLVITILLPYFIDYAFLKKLVTNPKIHSHPGMLLVSPSARGGGFIYGVVFLILSIVFVGFQKEFSGLFLSVFLMALLGIIDDYQNTHPSSNLRIFEKPLLRLCLAFLAVLPVILSGVLISSVSNPSGGIFDLNLLTIKLSGNTISVIPALLTTIWIVWVMNVLSWSNGIDGQYAGIVGIASLVIALLATRFMPLEKFHLNVATLSAISAGTAFGFSRYTKSPSKIMWGFGAMCAGLTLSVLAIFAQSKIAFSILVILVPFMDAVVIFFRRIIQGKNPMSGDKGHLHHLLLARGWSIHKIVNFYWVSTAIFGLIGLLTPERYFLQITLIVVGIVAFAIVLLNIRSFRKAKDSSPVRE